MLSLSRNKCCLCNRGWTWTTSGSTISHQSTSKPSAKWSREAPVSLEPPNNWTRISEHVFKGINCWGVHTAGADLECCPLWLEMRVVAMAWMKSSRSGEFAIFSFRQATKKWKRVSTTAKFENWYAYYPFYRLRSIFEHFLTFNLQWFSDVSWSPFFFLISGQELLHSHTCE